MRQLFLVSLTLLCVGASPPRYTLQDLGAITPTAINDQGISTGRITAPPGQAVLAVPGTSTPLPFLPGGFFSRTNALNKTQAVGLSSTGPGGSQIHATLWTLKQGVIDLGTLGDPSLTSAATGVNESEAISGYGTRLVPGGSSVEARATVWIQRHIADLGTLGGAQAFSYAVNESGDIVGESQTSNGVWHATLWPVDGVPIDLDTLGSTRSQALALNDDLDVVGLVAPPGAGQRAFLKVLDQPMQTLPLLSGYFASAALGINADGLIVGMSRLGGTSPSQEQSRAMLWLEDQTPVDLNSQVRAAGWVLQQAVAINEPGQIVGLSTLNGQPRAFLLTPIAGTGQAQSQWQMKAKLQRWRSALKQAWKVGR
jgi:probable HAF family extracellular repeat protein